jgi:hypothetical protein
MQTHQRVEDQQAGTVCGQGEPQSLAVAVGV